MRERECVCVCVGELLEGVGSDIYTAINRYKQEREGKNQTKAN